MNPLLSRQWGGINARLLRLEYWFDRRSELQRLVVGLGAIVFLGTSWLYVLGISSVVIVSRAEILEPMEVTLSPQPAAEVKGGTVEPVASSASPTPAPAVDSFGNLIEPPEVPEVAIIPAPPRPVMMATPPKPRVVATTPTAGATLAPVAPTTAPRTGSPITSGATPIHTPGTPGANVPAGTPPTQRPGTATTATPARAPNGATAVATKPSGPTPPPSKPGVATPTPTRR